MGCGERVVIERHGKPVAALVSLADLRRLEELEPRRSGEEDDRERQARLRAELEKAGVTVRWPSGAAVSAQERKPVRVQGEPVSEQIIAERR
jgi:hypothetical protein